MRRVISRPPTRSATSAHHCHPSLTAPPRPAPTPPDGSRSCQPQLSFIVPTIYDSVYTERRYQGVPNFPAIHQRAIARISSPATAHHAAFFPRISVATGRGAPPATSSTFFLPPLCRCDLQSRSKRNFKRERSSKLSSLTRGYDTYTGNVRSEVSEWPIIAG